MAIEDDAAAARAAMGFSRELQQQRTANPDPSRGGARGYDVHDRQWQLTQHAAGNPVKASLSSLRRWQQRLHPYRMTGNKERASIVGVDQILLTICITVYPQASLKEIAAFIYREGGGLYSDQAISKRLAELRVTRKKVSVEAQQAFTAINLQRVQSFWSSPPPLGVQTVRRARLIDVDEFGIELNRCNRTHGWSLEVFRVRTIGHYTRTQKLTVLVAIEAGNGALPAQEAGSLQHPGRWIQVVRNAGTTADTFNTFVRMIMASIEARTGDQITRGLQNAVEQDRVFLWDNLKSHLTPLIANTLYAHNGPSCFFQSVPRPPYQPKYGPIEYKICDIVAALKKQSHTQSWTTDDLEHEVYAAFAGIGGFDATFDHCGYTVNGL